MKLVVLGAPGAGKGTQAENLAERFGIAHISTGDILRAHVADKTEIGEKVRDLLQNGSLVPDEIAIDIVEAEIAKVSCFILDGFPRTLSQTTAVKEISPDKLDCVIYVDVSDEVIVGRMAGRVVCEKCGKMYHAVNYPPKVAHICDKCGGTLTQRDDDKPETVLQRLRIYHELTEPIISFYEKQNVLLRVDGKGDADEITESIVKYVTTEVCNGRDSDKE